MIDPRSYQVATEDPSPPLCCKCLTRPKRQNTHRLRPYCLECELQIQKERRDLHKPATKLCPVCGEHLPHAKNYCPEGMRQGNIRRGRIKLNERWPGYGDALTDERWLEKIGHSWGRSAFPPPSVVFPGLNPNIDARLISVERDKDVAFCRTLAQVPSQEQRDYLELALLDPADATRWASLPPYQRPIRKGDRDDIAIWKFFTMQRLNMNLAATDYAWALPSQGAQLPQMFGVLAWLTPAGLQKLVLVMSAYGSALQAGRPLGNVTKKPWED